MNSENYQIRGLYFIWDASPDTPYLQAISTDRNKLLDMVPLLQQNLKKNNSFGEIRIKNVDHYQLEVINNKILFSKYLLPKSVFIKDKTYCMNLVSIKNNKEYVDQVLVTVINDYNVESKEHKDFIEEINNHELFKNNLSSNPVQLDILYEEGVING